MSSYRRYHDPIWLRQHVNASESSSSPTKGLSENNLAKLKPPPNSTYARVLERVAKGRRPLAVKCTEKLFDLLCAALDTSGCTDFSSAA